MAGTIIHVTQAGRAALVAAGNTGTNARKVVSIGVSTAPFDDTDETLIALPGERKRIATIAGENVAPDTIHVTLKDDTADQYSLYGLGLYLDNGVLFAVYSQAAPIMEKSPAAMLMLAADMQFTKIDAAQLYFGDATFTNPPSTTERQGVVELATNAETIAGTDAQRAVTPAGLQATIGPALALKSNVGHKHAIAEVDGLQSALDSKLNLTGGTLKGNLTLANSQSLVLQSTNGTYTGYFRADPSNMIGLINQAQTAWNMQVNDNGVVAFPRARPNWAGLTPWDNGNFDPNTKLTNRTGNTTSGLNFQSGTQGSISGITAAGQATGLTISNGANPSASAVISFLRDGAYGAHFGLDTDNQFAVGGWSFGNVRYRLWHEGNLNPVPVRPGLGGYGYVQTDSGNRININWDGNFRIWVDGQYGSALWGSHNFDPNSRAVNGARVQWDSGIQEVGPIGNGTIGDSAPWVCVGGRSCGNSSTANCIWLHLAVLRNQ
jgi:hypothetical protein